MSFRGATGKEVVGKAIPALAETRLVLDELDLPVAAPKSHVLCSSKALEAQWVLAVGAWAGKCGQTARRLGVDHQLVAVRRKPVGAARKVKYEVRKKLLKHVGETGWKAKQKVHMAGLLPAILFGAELGVPHSRALTKLRADTVAVRGLRQAGVATDLALLALPPQLDPMCRVIEAIILRWHREVWYFGHPHISHPDVIHPGKLQEALTIAGVSKDPQHFYGPAAAARWAIEQLGWNWITAVRILDHSGEVLELRFGTPMCLRAMIRRRWTQVQAERGLGHRLENVLAKEQPEAVAIRNSGWDVGPLVQVLRSKAKNGLRWREKKALTRFVAGNHDKFLRGPCPKCGQADSQDHRLNECPDEEVVRLRAHLEEHKGLRDWTAKAKVQLPLGLIRGWFALRKPSWVARANEVECFPEDCELNEDFFLADNPVFVDGSCFFALFPEITVAGFAALQINKDGQVLRAIWGPVPQGIVPTAAMGEHMAAKWAVRLSTKGRKLVIDCLSVIKTLQADPCWASDWRRPMGGVWDDVDYAGTIATKVKAHRSAELARIQGDSFHHKGNEEVDALAKKGALTGCPEEKEIQNFCNTFGTRKRYLKAVGKVLGAWNQWPGDKLLKGVAVKSKDKGPDHDLIWFGPTRVWHCGTCSGNFRSKAAALRTKCSSVKRTLAQVAQEATDFGHSVYVIPYVQQPTYLIACLVCGSYAQARVETMLSACQGKPRGSAGGQSGRRRVVKAFAEQQAHPFHKVPMGRPVKWGAEPHLDVLELGGEEEVVKVNLHGTVPVKGNLGFDSPEWDIGQEEEVWGEVFGEEEAFTGPDGIRESQGAWEEPPEEDVIF